MQHFLDVRLLEYAGRIVIDNFQKIWTRFIEPSFWKKPIIISIVEIFQGARRWSKNSNIKNIHLNLSDFMMVTIPLKLSNKFSNSTSTHQVHPELLRSFISRLYLAFHWKIFSEAVLAVEILQEFKASSWTLLWAHLQRSKWFICRWDGVHADYTY